MDRKTSMLMSLGISIGLIAAGIWVLYHHHYGFGYADGGWAMLDQSMGSNGMGVVMIIFWIAVLSAIGLVISGIISNHHSSTGTDKHELR
jgi:uncharacterized membrane protein